MFGGRLGIPELVIVLVIALLVFGPSRLGAIGSSLGKGIRGFRKSLEDDDSQAADGEGAGKNSDGSEFRAPGD